MKWLIGDIHGMLVPLQALLGAVSREDPGAQHVFLGDYVNRGPDSRGVIELLLSLPNATFLRGNHDDVFDLLLHGKCFICHPSGRDPLAAFSWFMRHGLAETFMSYGADWAQLESAMRRPTAAIIEQFTAPVPQSHRDFVHRLQPVFESDAFFAAHGYWNPDDRDKSPGLAERLEADPALRYRLLWGRFTEAQLLGRKQWSRTGYFGHTPVVNYSAGVDRVPVRGPNVVLLDTALALMPEGMLSAVCADNGRVIQADRAGAIVELPGQSR